jgi:hypothetical protein
MRCALALAPAPRLDKLPAVDEELTIRLNELKDEILGAHDEVAAALESGEDAQQLAAGRHVEELARRYAELKDEIPDEEQDRLERGIGRRITDLRRAAMQLTRRDSGQKVERAVDAGQVPFLLQRQPPKSIVPPRAAPSAGPKFTVGGEVEAWCGKCREFREHNIVAIVDGQPKQVICQTCNSRHGYRTEPSGRGAKPAEGAAAPSAAADPQAKARRAVEERELQKKQDARRQLQKELADAVEPRPFDPKGRYKAGEIIVHPEHGRGKIENVLRGSLLVRFLEGLRPLNLQ